MHFISLTQMLAAQGGAAERHLWKANKNAYHMKKIILLLLLSLIY